MQPISYARHQFPPAVIQYAVWFLSSVHAELPAYEGLLAERGLEMSYESVRRGVLKLEPAIAPNLRQLRPRPGLRWHLDERMPRMY